MKTCGIIIAGVIAVIGIGFGVFILTPHAKTVFDPYESYQAHAAYTSASTYYVGNTFVGQQRLYSEFQPYSEGIATYEGEHVWRFRFWVDMRGRNGDTPKRVYWDKRLRSLAGDQWEVVQ